MKGLSVNRTPVMRPTPSPGAPERPKHSASPVAVMRMVLGHAGRLTVVGIFFGIAGALVVSRVIREALFEVDPADPLVYLVLSVALLLVAECASFFPARRAMRIDPVIALRTE